MEDAELSCVAGVVADSDGLTDVSGQDGAEVAGAVKADPVALHDPACRGGEQQQVEVLGVHRGAGDPGLAEPTLPGWLPGL